MDIIDWVYEYPSNKEIKSGATLTPGTVVKFCDADSYGNTNLYLITKNDKYEIPRE